MPAMQVSVVSILAVISWLRAYAILRNINCQMVTQLRPFLDTCVYLIKEVFYYVLVLCFTLDRFNLLN